jgi:Fe-S oxidoreductase
MNDFVPFPIDRKMCSRWAEGLPNTGRTILYTSMMYQMSPTFKSYERLLPKVSKIRGAESLSFLGKYLFKPEKEELERAYRILSNISRMLTKSGVQFGYLYEVEPYSGAILIELGMRDEFRNYGEKLLSFFHERGVEKLITVDPHTTNALVRLKEYLDFDIEVVNYVTLLRGITGSGEFVLHDSCLYSKHLGMRDSIRTVIGASGVTLKENSVVTGRETAMCCGSPVGVVNSEVGESIAKMRATRLASVSGRVLVMCPLCYQNLSPNLDSVLDFAEVVR